MKSSIIINSPIQRVWDMQKDVASWKKWDDEMVLSEGNFDDGYGFVKTPYGPKSKMYFLDVRENETYTIKVPVFLSHFYLRHEFKKIDDNKTELSYELTFKGLLAGIFKRTLGKKMFANFPKMLSEAKLKCEQDANVTVLITGATSGIGLEFAKQYSQKGYDLVLVSRDEGKLKNVKSEITQQFSNKVEIITSDLSKPDAYMEVFQQLENKRIDLLINNAGFGLWDNFDNYNINIDIDMINLNVLTVVKFTKLFVKKFKNQGFGKILNIGSTAGFQPGPLSATYFATKSFIVNFSVGLSYELQKEGSNIFVGVLNPGPTKTDFGKSSNMNNTNLGNSLMSAEEVVSYGIKKFSNKNYLIIAGFKNRVLIFMNRISKLSMLLGIVYKMNKKPTH